jgi:neogenin
MLLCINFFFSIRLNFCAVFLYFTVPPKFLKRPSDRFALEKEDVEFECAVYGKPEPLVHWVKNGDIIVQNDYLQVVNGYNLRILGLMEIDAGIFQCIGSNAAGNIQAAARLTIMQPGNILSVKFTVGSDLRVLFPPF